MNNVIKKGINGLLKEKIVYMVKPIAIVRYVVKIKSMIILIFRTQIVVYHNH